jgi:hypothetical protein
MTTDFDFGLSDLLDQGDGGRTVGGWIAAALAVVFFLLSGMTTAAFFFRFAPGLGFLFGPTVGPYVAAAVGVVCLDLAALAWGYVRARGCSSRQQQTLAAVVGAVDLVGALLVSGLYVLLAGSTLDAGIVDPATGVLTDFGQGLHLLGTVVITLALVLNFAAVWVFSALSADTRTAAHATELAAVVRDAQHMVAKQRARQVLARSIHDINQALPAAAATVASDNTRRYLTHTMRTEATGAGLDQPATASTATPSTNGHRAAHFFDQGGRP